jgi:small subunit ribosomal protein S3Ae
LVKKSKGKKWYTILAPEMFGNVEIGQTSANEPDILIGRKVDVNLMKLMNDFKKYYMKFVFKIVSVDGSNALTEFDGLECISDYVSRMVLRYSRRVDTIQDLNTKDGFKLRVKGLAIIKGRVKSSIKDNIRNVVREIIKREVEKSTMESFIKGVISDIIKNRVLRESRRIYPIHNFEIRKTEILVKPTAQS